MAINKNVLSVHGISDQNPQAHLMCNALQEGWTIVIFKFTTLERNWNSFYFYFYLS